MRRYFIFSGIVFALAAAWASGQPEPPQTETPAAVFEPEYRLALPGYVYAFPRDHGSHPEYKIEWWYYTGHLDAEDGRRFGYELTFFRVGMDRVADNPSVWNVRDLHVAHFALADLTGRRFRYFEKVNRAGPGIAHAAEATLDLENAGWRAALRDDGSIGLRAYAGGILLELDLAPQKAPAVHGGDGISRKGDGEGRASHYYSLTRIQTSGLLSIDGEAVRVSGESWMDHEFGTNQLAPEQIGWDWFSLQLDNGEELMLYQLRHRDGALDRHSSGSIVGRDGAVRHLALEQFQVRSLRQWASPESGAVYRLDWEIEIPGARLRVTPLMDEQELVTTRSTGVAYWEGAVQVEGVWNGAPVTGRGYVELTGYADAHRPDI